MTTETINFAYDHRRGLTGTVRFALEEGGTITTKLSLPGYRPEVKEAVATLKQLLAEDVDRRLKPKKRSLKTVAS